MEGVTTAIVAFIFVCVVFPNLVKQKTQFYAALAAVVLILLVQAVGLAVNKEAFNRVVGFITALLQIAGILMLFLACGGLSARELMGEMGRAFEVIRRGEEEKEVIIPLTGQQPKARRDDADYGAGAPRAPRRRDDDSASVPLE
jgi:protein-S-isoprenylcysteine O-methyltransferase Ste14